MGDQDFLVVLVKRNFLKFGRLLAADTSSGLKPHDIAGLAEIADAIKFSVMDGEEIIHLEIAVRAHFTLQADFIISQAFILERMEDVLVAPGQRDLLCGGFQYRPGSLNKKKLALEGL